MWNREELLKTMSVWGRHHEAVLRADVSAEALVSWRLQAATQHLQAPGAYVATRAVQAAGEGAGGLFDELAELGPEQLATLMYWATIGQMKGCPPALEQLALEYRQVIGRRLTPDVLGLRAQVRALTQASGQVTETSRYDGYLRLRSAYAGEQAPE